MGWRPVETCEARNSVESVFLVNQHTHTAAVLETQRRNGKVCRSTQVKRDTKCQKIHNGTDKESASAYASLAVKVEARENLQGKHVTDDENAEWIELKRTKYPRLSGREAAKRIKVETGTEWSERAVRDHTGWSSG